MSTCPHSSGKEEKNYCTWDFKKKPEAGCLLPIEILFFQTGGACERGYNEGAPMQICMLGASHQKALSLQQANLEMASWLRLWVVAFEFSTVS